MNDAHDANSEAQRESLFNAVRESINTKPEAYNKALKAVESVLNASGPIARCAPVAVAYGLLRNYLADMRQHFPAVCEAALLEGTLNALGDLIDETTDADDLVQATGGQKPN